MTLPEIKWQHFRETELQEKPGCGQATLLKTTTKQTTYKVSHNKTPTVDMCEPATFQAGGDLEPAKTPGSKSTLKIPWGL